MASAMTARVRERSEAGPGGPASLVAHCVELLLDPLGVDRELDLVADEHAARFQRDVVRESPILAVDLGLGGESDSGVAPRRVLRAEVLALQGDGAGRVPHGELALQGELAVA